jgi:membrane protein
MSGTAQTLRDERGEGLPARTGSSGRTADRPTDIPKAGWVDVGRRVKTQVREDTVTLVGAGVAFYGFIALIPTLIATVSIYGMVASPDDVAALADDALEAAPDEVATMIEAQLTSIVEQDPGGLGLAAAASIAVALWAASAGMAALVLALNIAYNESDDRGFVARRAWALLLTLGAVIFAAVAVGLIVALPAAIEAAGLGTAASRLLNLGRWPLLLGAFLVALAVLYRFAPNRSQPQLRWTSPGALIATGLWIVASVGFSIYAENFGNYNETYGSLSAIVVLLLWMWLTAVVIILGAEINSELEHQTAHDTTTGDTEAMGHRGAWSADHAAGPSAGRARGADEPTSAYPTTDADGPPSSQPTAAPDRPRNTVNPGGSMSDQRQQPPYGSAEETARRAEGVRDEAREVVGETQQQAQDVVRHAGDAAADVVDETRHEVRAVVHEAKEAVAREVDGRTRQTGSALRDFSRDLHEMSEQGTERTSAAQYVDMVADSVERLAARLEEGGADGIVDDVRRRAEQNPAAFASGAAFAGFLTGRMVRNAQRPGQAEHAGQSTGAQSTEGQSMAGGEADTRSGGGPMPPAESMGRPDQMAQPRPSVESGRAP